VQFEEFSDGLDAKQGFHVRQRAFGIGAQDVDGLEADFHGAGLGGLHGGFNGVFSLGWGLPPAWGCIPEQSDSGGRRRPVPLRGPPEPPSARV
jgi:hypothetical protein